MLVVAFAVAVAFVVAFAVEVVVAAFAFAAVAFAFAAVAFEVVDWAVAFEGEMREVWHWKRLLWVELNSCESEEGEEVQKKK